MKKFLLVAAAALMVVSASAQLSRKPAGSKTMVRQNALPTATFKKYMEVGQNMNPSVLHEQKLMSKHFDKENLNNVTLTAADMPENVSIDSASGDGMIYVPENSDFTANIDTASGDFNTDIPLTHKGDKYICGSGNNKINIDTASGDVSINKTA